MSAPGCDAAATGAGFLVERLGPLPSKLELANALLGVYQMIGKLEPRTYVLRAVA